MRGYQRIRSIREDDFGGVLRADAFALVNVEHVEEVITPCRFRTTVLTDIYDETKDNNLTKASAGHTTAAMTL